MVAFENKKEFIDSVEPIFYRHYQQIIFEMINFCLFTSLNFFGVLQRGFEALLPSERMLQLSYKMTFYFTSFSKCSFPLTLFSK